MNKTPIVITFILISILSPDLAFSQTISKIHADQNLGSLLNILDPAFTNSSHVNLTLDILAPVVNDLGVRAPLKEQIGEAALRLISQQDISTPIRTNAIEKVLYTLAVDNAVSAQFKEKMGANLQEIVFNEQNTSQNQEAINGLKLASLETISTITEDPDVNASFKEDLIIPLLELENDPELSIKSLSGRDHRIGWSYILLSPLYVGE